MDRLLLHGYLACSVARRTVRKAASAREARNLIGYATYRALTVPTGLGQPVLTFPSGTSRISTNPSSLDISRTGCAVSFSMVPGKYEVLWPSSEMARSGQRASS